MKCQSEEELKKEALIDKLEDSTNFKNTHAIIDQLKMIEEWTDKQKTKLIQIALNNTQVWYILNDDDIKKFYMSICENYNSSNCQAKCNSLVEKVNRRNKVKTFSGAIVNQIKNSIKALS